MIKNWDWSDWRLRFVRAPYFLYIENLLRLNLRLPYGAEGGRRGPAYISHMAVHG